MLRRPHPLISAGRRVLPRRRPDRFTLLLAGLGVLGAALALAMEVSSGVGLGFDQVTYISVARSLLAGDGFSEFDGDLYHVWPPLYPLLLAVASLGVFDPLTVAGPLNAAIFGLTVFVVGSYLRTRLESRLLTLWGGLALALAWPLLEAATSALSDALFILLTTLALIQADRTLSARGAGARLSALIWVGVFTALAGLTRYLGVTLVAALVPLLALQRGVALPEKAQRIIIFTLLSLAPLGLWLLRNQLITGTLTGFRDYQIPVSAADLLYGRLNIIAEWLLPEPPVWYFELPSDFTFLLGAGVFALLAIVLGRTWWAHCTGNANAAHLSRLPFAWFAVVYVTAEIGAFLQGASDNFNSPRYITPIYLPLLLTALFALDPTLRYARRYRLRPGRGRTAAVGTSVVLIAGLFLWLAWQIPVNARTIIQVNGGQNQLNTSDYSSLDKWADSAALSYLRADITDGIVFSNEAAASYIHSGGATRHSLLVCSAAGIRLQLATARAAGAVYLLWLYGAPTDCRERTDYYGGLDGLLAAVPVEPLAAFNDGVLFSYRPAGDNANDRIPDPDPAAARRDLRQRYAAIAAGVPAAVSDSGFNLYLDDARAPRWITYINDQCAPGATQALFHLHLFPVDRIYLAGTERRHGFASYAFNFDQDGIRIGNQCMVSVRLPTYAISNIRTGQHNPDAGVLWEVEYEPGRPERLRAELATAANQPPASQAGDFAVYHSGNRLIYAKTPCAPDDTAAPFFLLITPTFADDLPADLRQHGVDNRGFRFYQAGALLDGRQCVAAAALPDYHIATIHTGQNVPGGGGVLWGLEYEPDRPGRLRAELAAARQSQPPVIQSDFAVYHSGGRLIYAKTPCAPADTEATFLLHIVPVAANDLPESGQPHGFDNRDFAFNAAGALLDGQQCIASVALPDYDIAAIRTGQYVPGAGRRWDAEFAPAAR